MLDGKDYSGMAALSICESMLLALNDHKFFDESEVLGILEDAATAHVNAAREGPESEMHEAVAALIHRIVAGGNSVRRR